MKVTYDSEVDVFHVLFSHAPIEESDEDKPGVILDYDKTATSWAWKFWTRKSVWVEKKMCAKWN